MRPLGRAERGGYRKVIGRADARERQLIQSTGVRPYSGAPAAAGGLCFGTGTSRRPPAAGRPLGRTPGPRPARVRASPSCGRSAASRTTTCRTRGRPWRAPGFGAPTSSRARSPTSPRWSRAGSRSRAAWRRPTARPGSRARRRRSATRAPLAVAIRRALLPSGEVADDASPRLAELRRTLRGSGPSCTSVMEGYLHGPRQRAAAAGPDRHHRNDRYVLLVKAEQQGQLPGHRPRQLGLRREPLRRAAARVELNNDIVDARGGGAARGRPHPAGAHRAFRGAGADRRSALARRAAELDVMQAKALLAAALDADRARDLDRCDAARAAGRPPPAADRRRSRDAPRPARVARRRARAGEPDAAAAGRRCS